MSIKDRFIIKAETIEQASSYVPLMKKEQVIEKAASKCIDTVELAAKDTAGNVSPMPPFFRENGGRKSRYLMGIFVKFYLRQNFEPTEDDVLMALDDYDRYAGSHVFNQLESIKQSTTDRALRNKIFDIITDYKDFEKRFNSAVYSEIRINNDSCNRILATISQRTTPQALETALDGLNAVKSELDDYLANKNAPDGEKSNG